MNTLAPHVDEAQALVVVAHAPHTVVHARVPHIDIERTRSPSPHFPDSLNDGSSSSSQSSSSRRSRSRGSRDSSDGRSTPTGNDRGRENRSRDAPVAQSTPANTTQTVNESPTEEDKDQFAKAKHILRVGALVINNLADLLSKGLYQKIAIENGRHLQDNEKL